MLRWSSRSFPTTKFSFAFHHLKRRRNEGTSEDDEEGRKKMRRSQPVGDLEETWDWAHLPSELIQLVCEWLPFRKVIRLNEVCSLWKDALDDEHLRRGD